MPDKTPEKNGSFNRNNILESLPEYSKIRQLMQQELAKLIYGDYNALDEPTPSLGLTRKARRGDLFVDKYYGCWAYNPIRIIRNHYKGGRFTFDTGLTEPQPGDVIHGNTSLAVCTVQSVELSSGSWAGHDAAGTIYFESLSGFFVDNEDIKNAGNVVILTVTNSPVYVAEFLLSDWTDLSDIVIGCTVTGQTSGAEFTCFSNAIDVTIPMDSSGNPGLSMHRMIVELTSTNQTAFASDNELLTVSGAHSGTVTYKNATFRPKSDIYDIFGEQFFYVLKIQSPPTPVNPGAVYSAGGDSFVVAQVAGGNILYTLFQNPDGTTWNINSQPAATDYTLVSGIGPATVTLEQDFTGLPDNSVAYQSNFFNAHYLFNHVTTTKIDYTMYYPDCSVVISFHDYGNTQLETMVTSFGAALSTAQKKFFRFSASEDAVNWVIIADSMIQDLSSNAETHLLFHPKPGTNYKFLKIENSGADYSGNSPSDDISIKVRGLCYTHIEIDEGEESENTWDMIRPRKYFYNYVVPVDPVAVGTNPRTFVLDVPLEGYYKVDAFLNIDDLNLIGDTIACPTTDIDILEVQGSGETGYKLIDRSGWQGGGVGVTQTWRRGSLQGSAEVHANSSKQITVQFTRNNGSFSKISQGFICYEYLGKFRPGSQTE